MTYLVKALIADRSTVNGITRNAPPLLVECTVERWDEAVDGVLLEYASMRGGRRNFDQDSLELSVMSVMLAG